MNPAITRNPHKKIKHVKKPVQNVVEQPEMVDVFEESAPEIPVDIMPIKEESIPVEIETVPIQEEPEVLIVEEPEPIIESKPIEIIPVKEETKSHKNQNKGKLTKKSGK